HFTGASKRASGTSCGNRCHASFGEAPPPLDWAAATAATAPARLFRADVHEAVASDLDDAPRRFLRTAAICPRNESTEQRRRVGSGQCSRETQKYRAVCRTSDPFCWQNQFQLRMDGRAKMPTEIVDRWENLASRQHGLLSRRQAFDCGLTS